MIVTGQQTKAPVPQLGTQRPLTANKPPQPQAPLATASTTTMDVRKAAAARVTG